MRDAIIVYRASLTEWDARGLSITLSAWEYDNWEGKGSKR